MSPALRALAELTLGRPDGDGVVWRDVEAETLAYAKELGLAEFTIEWRARGPANRLACPICGVMHHDFEPGGYYFNGARIDNIVAEAQAGLR